MYILAVESSCDETSVAITDISKEYPEVLSVVTASQIDIHKLYGGVVPEIASRAHTEAISRITKEALDIAGVEICDLCAVAVTYSPGLVGALLVGVNFAKSFAYANGLPLIPVNHICGHVAANYIDNEELKPPFLALVASGGHTSIIKVKDYTDYETIGFTRDDAIGEAFDKVARVMGIPYPGGAQMDALAKVGNPDAVKFPCAAIAGDNLEFSFSGLKTAVINYLHNCEQKGETVCKEDVAASFAKTVCESVEKKLSLAIDKTGYKTLVLAGGVAANSQLRNTVSELCRKKNVKLFMPQLKYCSDNGAMIRAQAYYEYKKGNFCDTSLNAQPQG